MFWKFKGKNVGFSDRENLAKVQRKTKFCDGVKTLRFPMDNFKGIFPIKFSCLFRLFSLPFVRSGAVEAIEKWDWSSRHLGDVKTIFYSTERGRKALIWDGGGGWNSPFSVRRCRKFRAAPALFSFSNCPFRGFPLLSEFTVIVY